jgi:hypothetical protein
MDNSPSFLQFQFFDQTGVAQNCKIPKIPCSQDKIPCLCKKIPCSVEQPRNCAPSETPLRCGRSGRRVYGPRELRSLAFVRRARELGFSIEEIRSLLVLGAPGNASCREVREVAQ